MSGLRAPHDLAQALGEELGTGKVLLRPLPGKQKE